MGLSLPAIKSKAHWDLDLKTILCSLYGTHLINMAPEDAVDLMLDIYQKKNSKFLLGWVLNSLWFLEDRDLIDAFKKKLTPEMGALLMESVISMALFPITTSMRDDMDDFVASATMQETLTTIHPAIDYPELALALIRINKVNSNQAVLKLLDMPIVRADVSRLLNTAARHKNHDAASALLALSVEHTSNDKQTGRYDSLDYIVLAEAYIRLDTPDSLPSPMQSKFWIC